MEAEKGCEQDGGQERWIRGKKGGGKVKEPALGAGFSSASPCVGEGEIKVFG